MKGQTAYYAVAIIAVLAVAMVAIGGWPYIGSPIGFTTIGLSSADFKSTSEAFNGEQFILTVVQGGMGQYATGTISSAAISSATGETVDRNFDIDMTYTEQSCNYQITKTNSQAIYAYQMLTTEPALWCDDSWAASRCGSDYVAKGNYLGGCWCVRRTLQTTAVSYNGIENPSIRTISDITVSNGDDVDTFKMDTQGDSRGWIGDNVYVIHNGDLVRSYCPSQSPYYGFYVQGSWRIGQAENYEDYKITKQSVDSGLYTLSNLAYPAATPDVRYFVDQLNDATAEALTPTYFGSLHDSSFLDGATIKNTYENFVNVPMYTFYIKADYLTITQRVPNIMIVSASAVSFQTDGEARIRLYNTGDSGNARVWVDCPAPFSSNVQKEVGVSANDYETVWIPLSINTDIPVCKICTAWSDDGFNDYSKAFEVCADPEKTCEPYVKECTPENQIRQCNEFGSGYSIIETCEVLCDYDMSGQPYCTENPPPPSSGFLWLIIPVSAILLGLVGYFYRDEVTALILGIIGALIGYVIYWWLSLDWWAQLLIQLGLGGLGAIGIYLFGASILAFIVAIVVAKIK